MSNNEAILSFLESDISGSLGGTLNHLPTAAEIMGVIHLEPSEARSLDPFGVESVLEGY